MPVLQTRQPFPSDKPRLLDQVRSAIRRKHYSIRTEEAYVDWIKRYIFFHHKRHPLEMAEPEIEQYLNHLAVVRKVASSTQKQGEHFPFSICHFSLFLICHRYDHGRATLNGNENGHGT